MGWADTDIEVGLLKRFNDLKKVKIAKQELDRGHFRPYAIMYNEDLRPNEKKFLYLVYNFRYPRRAFYARNECIVKFLEVGSQTIKNTISSLKKKQVIQVHISDVGRNIRIHPDFWENYWFIDEEKNEIIGDEAIQNRNLDGLYCPYCIGFNPCLTETEVNIMTLIHNFTVKKQKFFMRKETIADTLGQSTKTIKNSLAHLISKNWLRQTSKNGKNNLAITSGFFRKFNNITTNKQALMKEYF